MPNIYTTSEAADILKVKEPTIRGWINAGKLKASMIGGSKTLRITEESINELMENNEIKQ